MKTKGPFCGLILFCSTPDFPTVKTAAIRLLRDIVSPRSDVQQADLETELAALRKQASDKPMDVFRACGGCTIVSWSPETISAEGALERLRAVERSVGPIRKAVPIQRACGADPKSIAKELPACILDNGLEPGTPVQVIVQVRNNHGLPTATALKMVLDCLEELGMQYVTAYGRKTVSLQIFGAQAYLACTAREDNGYSLGKARQLET